LCLCHRLPCPAPYTPAHLVADRCSYLPLPTAVTGTRLPALAAACAATCAVIPLACALPVSTARFLHAVPSGLNCRYASFHARCCCSTLRLPATGTCLFWWVLDVLHHALYCVCCNISLYALCCAVRAGGSLPASCVRTAHTHTHAPRCTAHAPRTAAPGSGSGLPPRLHAGCFLVAVPVAFRCCRCWRLLLHSFCRLRLSLRFAVPGAFCLRSSVRFTLLPVLPVTGSATFCATAPTVYSACTCLLPLLPYTPFLPACICPGRFTPAHRTPLLRGVSTVVLVNLMWTVLFAHTPGRVLHAYTARCTCYHTQLVPPRTADYAHCGWFWFCGWILPRYSPHCH